MSTDPKFNAAILQEIAWKNGEMQRFAVALVRRALAQGGLFTTDIVPDSERGDGPGIAGSVVELLKNAHVLKPVGFDHAGTWYAKREQSSRPDRKCAWLNVYQLTSPALAAEFLRRHGGAAAAPVQQDFFSEFPLTNLAGIAR